MRCLSINKDDGYELLFNERFSTLMSYYYTLLLSPSFFALQLEFC